jgi:putative peptidoglycan lipid II flippase
MSSAPSAIRQIARATGTVMVAQLLAHLTNLVSLSLNARAFGTQGEMDAFLAANRVAETLFVLMAGGALSSAFIPMFTGLLTRNEHQTAWNLASAIANLLVAFLTLGALLAAIFAQPLVHYVLAPGFASDPQLETLTVNLLYIMLPSAVIFGISGLVMGILNSHQIFFLPALTPALYRGGMIFGVLVLAPRWGIYGLAWGVLLGASLHLLCQIPSLLRLHGHYFPTFRRRQPAVREVGLLMAPRVFGVAVVQLNFWVNTRLASLMVEGSVTSVSWALTIMLLPQGIIAQSVAMAALPTLAAQFALGKMDDLRASLSASLRGILLLALPASLGLILLRQPVVALLLEYGKFDANSTQMIAWALLWYAAGLVGHCIVEILSRAFYAVHNTYTPVLVGAAAMALNVLLSIRLSEWFIQLDWMPHGGLALANSLATGLEAIALFLLMRKRLGGLHGRTLLDTSLRAGLATLAMGLALWGWSAVASGAPAWLVALGGVMCGGLVYGLAVLALGVPEARSLGGWLLQKVKS